jgi:hypothetical protein
MIYLISCECANTVVLQIVVSITFVITVSEGEKVVGIASTTSEDKRFACHGITFVKITMNFLRARTNGFVQITGKIQQLLQFLACRLWIIQIQGYYYMVPGKKPSAKSRRSKSRYQ